MLPAQAKSPVKITIQKRAFYVRTTDDGATVATVVFPPSLRCLPVPEAFREIERGLTDAQEELEARVLRAG